VTPLLAALEVQEGELRAVDVGRLGGEGAGAVEWVMRALGGELSERKLEREVEEHPPDAACATELGAVAALCELRDSSPRPFPVCAVISDLSPSAAWAQISADRFLVTDDEAAVTLADHGVDGHRVLVIGPVGEASFAAACGEDRAQLRRRYKLAGTVVVVEVAGLEVETVSQLALQLSLVEREMLFLFDAGSDRDVAAALRTQVPALGLRAKLFGTSEDAPLYWCCADALVARPTDRAVSRSLQLGVPLVCLSPEGGAESRTAKELEARGLGVAAQSPLMLSAALERLLSGSRKKSAVSGWDGAGACAAIALLLAQQKDEVVQERVEARAAARRAGVEDAAGFASWAAQAGAPAGALEDLGGAEGAPSAPPPGEINRLRAEVHRRRERVSRTLADAQRQAQSWDAKRASADKAGNSRAAQEAERNGDLERARMHAALQELAQLDVEEKRLESASEAAESFTPPPVAKSKKRSGGGTSAHARPSVDDELERLKQRAGSSASAGAKPRKKKQGKRKSGTSAVDDELAALKRKMARKRKR
jgi:UDP-N-acetylglucosamine:LPS N-acetylglucosamine transferase